MTKHVPVLLDALIDLLQPKPNEHYIDATLGGAGMANRVLEEITPNGTVTGIEQDIAAIERINRTERLLIVKGNFRDINKLVHKDKAYSGIYFDLGISTDQLEDGTRGISFQDESAPLDMRMSTDKKNFTAAQLLNNANEIDLVNVFSKYGEEQRSKTFAKEIVKIRKTKPFETVKDLLEVVHMVYPNKYYKKHPGTKVWQALRIAVNDELAVLEEVLPKAFELLCLGGVLAVISFHSLEDRIVKQYFKSIVKEGIASPLTKKVITPTEAEIKINPRARSSKLRGIKKGKK